MPEITIRKATDDDDEVLLAIFNSIYADQPPMGVPEYRAMRALQPQSTAGERYAAEIDGQVAGSLEFWSAPRFQKARAIRIFLEVGEPFRFRGIGDRLYRLMEERMPLLGLRRAYTLVRENHPDSLAFATRRAFVRTGAGDRTSRLEVRRVRLDRIAPVEDRLRDEGIRIATLAETAPDEDFLRAFHALENEVSRDIPSTEKQRDVGFDEWKAAVLDSPGRSADTIWLALEGERPVGVTRLNRRSEGAAVHGLTGVARTHRGRGIARALKRRSVLWAREHGIEFLYTDNDVDNLPMIAINDELGYQVLPGEIELMKEYPS